MLLVVIFNIEHASEGTSPRTATFRATRQHWLCFVLLACSSLQFTGRISMVPIGVSLPIRGTPLQLHPGGDYGEGLLWLITCLDFGILKLHTVYSGILEQTKPLQLVGQAAEFKFEPKGLNPSLSYPNHSGRLIEDN